MEGEGEEGGKREVFSICCLNMRLQQFFYLLQRWRVRVRTEEGGKREVFSICF